MTNEIVYFPKNPNFQIVIICHENRVVQQSKLTKEHKITEKIITTNIS